MAGSPDTLQHADLVTIAEQWLLSRGCAFAFRELRCVGTSETADAIGFRPGHGYSILIECKASRSDFLSDKKKIFRRIPELGVGTFRFFLAPDGVITPSDLPPKWGLLAVTAKGKVRMQAGPKGSSCWTYGTTADWMHEKDIKAEWCLMASALRRLHLRGVIPLIYDQPWKDDNAE